MEYAVQAPQFLDGYVDDINHEVAADLDKIRAGTQLTPDRQIHVISKLISLADPTWDQPSASQLHQVLFGLFVKPVGPPPTEWIQDPQLRSDIESAWLAEQRRAATVKDANDHQTGSKRLDVAVECWEMQDHFIGLARRLSDASAEPWAPPRAAQQGDLLALIWHVLFQVPPV